MENNNELLSFADEPLKDKAQPNDYWNILVVDDEQEVHNVTKLVLKDYIFDKKIKILNAYTINEAKAIILDHPDICVILLDVVMEKVDSGLKFVDYIRNELKNNLVRIIIRTGYPGKAPEESVVIDYDINDYKVKTELTNQKLYSSLTLALKSYTHEKKLFQLNTNLENILSAMPIPILISTKQDGTILYANNHLTTLVGIQIENLIDRKTPDFYNDPSERKILLDLLKRDGYIKNYEFCLKKANDTLSWVILSMKPFIYEDQEAFITAFLDITHRKKTEEALSQARGEFDRLSTTIHNSLKGKIDTARSYLDRFLTHNKVESKELTLTSKILSDCSDESKNILFTLTYKNCTINDLLKELEFRAETAFSHLNLLYSFDKEIKENPLLKPKTVHYLLDIYTEILNNIVKHSKASHVTIYVGYSDNKLNMKITDDGLGFDYPTISNKPHSYGLYMLKKLSSELNANLLIDTSLGNGTSINLNQTL